MTEPSICECCHQVVPSPPPSTEHIRPSPENLVCRRCGSAEVECLDWVRVNDNAFIGGNESAPADDYWCPVCEVHDKPIEAAVYCEEHGHRGVPCALCGEGTVPVA